MKPIDEDPRPKRQNAQKQYITQRVTSFNEQIETKSKIAPSSVLSSENRVPGTKQPESYLSRLRKKDQIKENIKLEQRASPGTTDFVTQASLEVSEHKKNFKNLNTISYGFGSNTTIRNSYNSKISPGVSTTNWLEKPTTKRQLNMTALDHIKQIASTPDNLTKNRSIQ